MSVPPTTVPARQPGAGHRVPTRVTAPAFPDVSTSATPWMGTLCPDALLCVSFCHCHSLGIAPCRLRLSGAWCLRGRSHLWSPLGPHACNSGGCRGVPVPLYLNRVTWGHPQTRRRSAGLMVRPPRTFLTRRAEPGRQSSTAVARLPRRARWPCWRTIKSIYRADPDLPLATGFDTIPLGILKSHIPCHLFC